MRLVPVAHPTQGLVIFGARAWIDTVRPFA